MRLFAHHYDRGGAMHRPLGWQDYAKLAIVGLVLVIAVFLLFRLAELIGSFECPGLSCKQKDLAKTISDVRASLLQIAVGVAGLVTLYFAWQTYLLGREGRASDNFIKAIDQLGNANVHARIGGVAGLGRLLKTATVDGDYWPIMDLLTAFVRQSVPVANTPPVIKPPDNIQTTINVIARGYFPESKPLDIPPANKPPEDIQTAINVIARRYLADSKPPLRTYDSPVDLSQCDLSGLWMPGGHYEGGHFVGSVFRKTRLENSFLSNTNFDRTDLTDAIFDRAKMQQASIRGVKMAQGASFKNANLTGASFEDSDLTGTSLQGAIVREADFSRAIAAQTLSEAVGDQKTGLPTGFSRPPGWL
jgi:hypothetical protein